MLRTRFYKLSRDSKFMRYFLMTGSSPDFVGFKCFSSWSLSCYASFLRTPLKDASICRNLRWGHKDAYWNICSNFDSSAISFNDMVNFLSPTIANANGSNTTGILLEFPCWRVNNCKLIFSPSMIEILPPV